MKVKTTVNFTVLSCNLQEDDVSRRQTCIWAWDDLTMDTRPVERVTLVERDAVLKQEYEKKEQTIFIIQRSPLQIMKVGRFGGDMRYYHLPYKIVLPIPIFTPNRIQTPLPEEPPTKIKTLLNGLCNEKREVAGLLSNLPQVINPNKLPLRISCLISPPPSLYGSSCH
uniref:Uncharacterized protein n=1 Tax=Leptobrachium leishanense TaxID=445787 RepID=A0A8C5M3I6_9ANUR